MGGYGRQLDPGMSAASGGLRANHLAERTGGSWAQLLSEPPLVDSRMVGWLDGRVCLDAQLSWLVQPFGGIARCFLSTDLLTGG
jgi:hypothetical protein